MSSKKELRRPDASSAAKDPSRVTIEFRPQDKKTHVPRGISLFNAANWIGLPIDSTCGGRGTCGKCKVRILRGNIGVGESDRREFSEEELADGWRLSCRAHATENIVCNVPRLMGSPKAALMGFGRHVLVDPNVQKVVLQLEHPSLADQRSDFARLRDALEASGFAISADVSVLRDLPHVLRQSQWQITAVIVGQQLVAVEPGDTSARKYGLAFDIGTTTVVAILIDLNSGSPLAVQSILNKQAIYGADVISRISYTMLNDDGVAILKDKIIDTLNELIDFLLAEAEVPPAHVYELVIVGNTTMVHLLLGLDPEHIGVTPFIPVLDGISQVNAHALGLRVHPTAKLQTLPHVGAYVGADLVGGLLATGLAQKEGVRLLVDVGTNGEIVLGSAERTIATAAPAGPAFEGAQIRDGMRATDGAIEAVHFHGDTVELYVIGDLPPTGLCGSGLVDAAAQLLVSGVLTPAGNLLSSQEVADQGSPGLAKRIINMKGMKAFVLAWPDETGHGREIVITQRDIRELQFAKGAIASGVGVVMRELGVQADDLVEIFLAGSFGSYINPRSAVIIGLVPPIPIERINAIGNSAGEGAKIALLSFREREVAYSISYIVEYLELSGFTDFNDMFVSVLQFPNLSELGLTVT